MVSKSSIWGRRFGVKYKLWAGVQLCTFVFVRYDGTEYRNHRNTDAGVKIFRRNFRCDIWKFN